jgi:tetratricopeptide (TPR) repeat protein
VLFLLGRIQVEDPSIEVREEAYKIVDTLGGLPLAIEQAAGYIKAPENISSYLRVFQRSRRQILGWKLTGNYPRTIATTWQLSFERLDRTSPTARSWLQYLAFMNPDEILVDYLRAGAAALPPVLQDLIKDPFEWGEVINALEESSLIHISARDTKFSIHRLLQAVIQDDLESSTRGEIETVLLDIGLNSFPKLDRNCKGIDACRQFRSQIVACLGHTKTKSIRWTELAERLAVFLFLEGIYVEASHWWGVVLALHQKSFGEENADTLRCTSELAKSLDRQGRSQDAITLNQNMLAIQKRVLGPEHPDTLDSMSNMAISYGHLGRFKEAADLQAETLDLRKWILGPDHPETLDSMSNMAISYGHLGRFKEAADLQAETLDLRKKILGPEHPDTYVSMTNFAISHNRSLGQFKESADLDARQVDSDLQEQDLQHAGDEAQYSTLEQASCQLFEEVNGSISQWLTLWEENPTNLNLLRRLQDAYNRKKERQQNDGSRTYSLLYIGWLAFLSLSSRWVMQWDILEVDWWPLASEDEVMLMRPYLCKTEWHCVCTTAFAQILIVRNTLAWVEMIGVMLTSKANLQKLPA